MKRPVVIGVVVAVVLLGLIAWRIVQRYSAADAHGFGRDKRTMAVAVRVQPVRRGVIRDVGMFTGTILPKEQFQVAPKVPGRLEWLGVAIGTEITNGQVVATLDSHEYAQQVAQAAAQLEVARAQVADAASSLSMAEKDFDRARELREQQVASQADLDAAESKRQAAIARHAIALAQVRQHEAALKADEVRLAYTRIAATWTGNGESRVIGERFVDEGAMLRANDPIVSVLVLDTVLACIYVVERDYPRIQPGQQVSVSADAYPGRAFSGVVARKAPLVKEASRQARVEIELQNAERLLTPGMFVRVAVAFDEHENALLAPAEALVRRDGKEGVFLVDATNKIARFVPVETGAMEGNEVEIISPVPVQQPIFRAL